MQESRLHGSCEWVLEKKEFKGWFNLNDRNSQVLWVYGILGCGKTFIFVKLLKNLRSNAIPAIFFLCVNGNDRRNSAASIVCSWTFQLLKRFPDAITIAGPFRNGNRKRSATQQEAMELLLGLLDSLPPCYLAIDGLDECDNKNDFVRFIQRIPLKHKILVVSREQSDIKGLLSASSTRMSRIKVDPQDMNDDINSYISERLAVDLYLQDENLNIIIRKWLLDCRGMFLWVRLMFDHLLVQTTIEELTDALDQLPSGLDETYDYVLKKINGLPDSQRTLANKVLMWVVTVHRPLTVAELRTALAIRPGDENLDQRRLIINPQSTILTLCEPLVKLVEPANVINTIHFTVNQYLLRYLEENRILPEITVHYAAHDFNPAHSLVAAICVTYLAFSAIGKIKPPSDCNDAVALSANQSPLMSLLSYASLHWFQQVRQTSYTDNSLCQLVESFLDPRKRNLGIWWHTYWFSGVDSLESRICPSQFPPMHVAAYLGLEKVVKSFGYAQGLNEHASHGRTPLWWQFP